MKFTSKGTRANRAQYWSAALLALLFHLCGWIVAQAGLSGSGPVFMVLSLALLGGALVGLVVLFLAAWRRLHDFGFSGWWILPLYFLSSLVAAGLWNVMFHELPSNKLPAFALFSIVLGLVPGQARTNKYGHVPQWPFSFGADESEPDVLSEEG